MIVKHFIYPLRRPQWTSAQNSGDLASPSRFLNDGELSFGSDEKEHNVWSKVLGICRVGPQFQDNYTYTELGWHCRATLLPTSFVEKCVSSLFSSEPSSRIGFGYVLPEC